MVVDEPTCQAALRHYHITPDMICAGGARGKDACNVIIHLIAEYKFYIGHTELFVRWSKMMIFSLDFINSECTILSGLVLHF